MDPEYARDVQRVFVDLYKHTLIYRGKRMVNWCPATQTALSDEEVEMKPQRGFMYHFRVEVAESAEFPGGHPPLPRFRNGRTPHGGGRGVRRSTRGACAPRSGWPRLAYHRHYAP